MNLTLKQYITWVEKWTFSPKEVVEHYMQKVKEKNSDCFAFVRFHEEYAKNNLENFSTKKLKSAPIGVKDLILTKGYETSWWSKILTGYIPPYSATVFERLENSWWLMIGKTNCDQFWMWSATEHSYFGKTINNNGKNRVPGWSSGWSAVSVSADLCLGALGTDTWWSSRQPAFMCGCVWLKPTYWRNSRYGVMPYASSFDQVWVFAKTVEDSKILLESIAGFDDNDSTTVNHDEDIKNRSKAFENIDIKKFKFALPKEFIWEWLDPRIKSEFLKIVDFIRKNGWIVDEIDLPILNVTLPTYYTLVPAEVSTNLSRLDGIRFGLQSDSMDHESIWEYYKEIRSNWFGDEAKRRILIWTFVLSSANYEWFYLKAQKVRSKLKYEINELFKKYDIIISPTSPELAWKIWEKNDDPMKEILADLYTVTANLVWIPAISIPTWFIEDRWEKMPRWIQLMAGKRREDILFSVWNWIEKKLL